LQPVLPSEPVRMVVDVNADFLELTLSIHWTYPRNKPGES